ncbi:MAG: hypothetical protein ACOC3A_05945, partial [Thermodesulfobacteriota bacterium]
AGVRFARMTTRNLYAALNSPLYRRLSAQAGNEFELNKSLTRWGDAAGVTFSELMESLSVETSASNERIEEMGRAVARGGECGDFRLDRFSNLIS